MSLLPPSPFLNCVDQPGPTQSAAAIATHPQAAAAEPITAARTDVLQTVGLTVSSRGDAPGCLTAADERLYWSLRFDDHPFERGLEHIPDAHALFDAAVGLSDLREAS
jgi:hypothetical protein